MGGSSAPTDVGNYTALLISSLVVLVLLGAVVWALTRWKGGARLGQDSTGTMKVRARLTLEPRRTLYVVTVGEKTLLIGTSEQGISTLADVSAEQLPEDVAAPSFAAMVRNAWQRPKATIVASAERNEAQASGGIAPSDKQ